MSSDILLGNPGYSYFTTADAIVFNGVTFRTICPSGYEGCPNVSGDKTITQLKAGDIVVSLGFQDRTNETVGSVIGDLSGNLTILSHHENPRAGIFIEYVQPSSTSNPETDSGLYRTFLLVEASTNTTAASCTISAGSAGFYLHVISDGSKKSPVEGVGLTVIPVSSCLGGGPFTTLIDSQQRSTRQIRRAGLRLIPPSSLELVLATIT